jgi:SAM-dependent methyltransferase
MLQSIYDFFGAPLRMLLLPDHRNEQLHLTSLRAERLAVVLPELQGRCLDIGAGDNMLVRLYQQIQPEKSARSLGLDVFDWGSGCVIVEDCRRLPFEDGEFDTVAFVACLNHIPERSEALAEAWRVLRPGGRVVVTMIGRTIGNVGHALWWYSEDKHREAQLGEVMGIDPAGVDDLLGRTGFVNRSRRTFVYGLNHLFIAQRPG